MTKLLQAPAVLTQKPVKGAEMFFRQTFPKNGRDAFLLIRSHETSHKRCEMLEAGFGEKRTVSFQQSLNHLSQTLMPASRAAAVLLKETLSYVDLFHACRSSCGGGGLSNPHSQPLHRIRQAFYLQRTVNTI